MELINQLPVYLLPTFVFLLGLAIGSFANVCIYRMPRKESVVSPGSHCTSCNTPIRPLDNIPIIGYLLLGAKCRSCGETISKIYPAIELVTALLMLAVYLKFGFSWESLIYLIVTPTLVIITAIDIKHQIIPDMITLPGIGFGLLTGWYLNGGNLDGLWVSLAGFALGGGTFYSISWAYYLLKKREGMGGGDIKYIAAAGMLLGWSKILLVIFLSALLGSLIGAVGLMTKKLNFLSKIPYGPFLALATYITIFWGDDLIRLYLEGMIVKR